MDVRRDAQFPHHNVLRLRCRICGPVTRLLGQALAVPDYEVLGLLPGTSSWRRGDQDHPGGLPIDIVGKNSDLIVNIGRNIRNQVERQRITRSSRHRDITAGRGGVPQHMVVNGVTNRF